MRMVVWGLLRDKSLDRLLHAVPAFSETAMHGIADAAPRTAGGTARRAKTNGLRLNWPESRPLPARTVARVTGARSRPRAEGNEEDERQGEDADSRTVETV
jgi:hypothetical protein